ncbi:ABC transporter permease [Vallicoccus soli]|uniref:ABC transporter permease n=1 Tax=Vallicoccus soli TaxID=2339232 RepID=UPI001C49A0A5|nr:ABC transporter permease [Vallicoccus soli]
MSTVQAPGAPEAPQRPAERGGAVVGRSLRGPVTLLVLGLLAVLAFGLGSDAGATSRFGLSAPDDLVELPELALPTRATATLLAVAGVVLALLALRRALAGRPAARWSGPAYGLALVLSFLVWAVADEAVSLVNLLQGSLLLAVPLVFGAMGGVLCERAGVVNIAIEGQLLGGAFLSAVVATLLGTPYAGLVAAPVAGLAVAALLALFAIRYAVDQVIVGVVLNVLVTGVTSFLYGRLLSPEADTWNSPDTFQRIEVPVLGDIPLVGPILFDQSIIVYLMYATVVVIHVALFHSRWGLRVRAVGEHPKAADTVGIDVNRTRWRNVLLGGLVAGLGGAYFTLGAVGAFGKEMTAGQGFIALAALIFGRWSPLGALAAALLFGFANQLQSVLGILGTPIPSDLMLMAPYLATLFAVAGLVGKVRAPAADGVPYKP